MSEAGDFEIAGAPAAKEKSEVSDEQFQEEMARLLQSLAQLRKEEGQYRAQDQNLAGVIVQFLNQPGNQDFFLLISRVAAQDVPSELILAVLALIDEKVTEEVYGLLRGGKEKTTALAVRSPHSFEALSPENKKVIDTWIQNIHQVALRRPLRTLESIATPVAPTVPGEISSSREIAPALLQLSAFVLRKYLASFRLNFEFETLRDFMQTVWVDLVKNLAQFLQRQKLLK